MNINPPAIPIDKDPLFQKLEKLLQEVIEAKSQGRIRIFVEYVPKSGKIRVCIYSPIQTSQNLVFQCSK